jgi:AraC family transcriptional regulator of adaptative response/methylated-DNA-[protein]-cysteine methyltransferase
MITIKKISTPLGEMCAGTTDTGICLLDFYDSKALSRDVIVLPKAMNTTIAEGEHHYIAQLEQQLNEYFAGKRKVFDLPLVVQGTDFQQVVWRTLLTIPYGKTISYHAQALQMGKPKSVRAVANANGTNRISIVIPCHRVIGSNGTLTGYGGGLWRKEWLLKLEMENS